MGKVYRQQLTGSRYVLQRVFYVLLYAVSVAALVLAGRLQSVQSTPFYAVLTELATVCLLVWLGYVLLVNYIPAPKEMTIHDYRSSAVAVNKSSFFLSIAFAADVLSGLLDVLLNGAAVQPAVLFLAGGAGAFILYRLEKKVVYNEETPHANEPEPEGSVTIENQEPGL